MLKFQFCGIGLRLLSEQETSVWVNIELIIITIHNTTRRANSNRNPVIISLSLESRASSVRYTTFSHTFRPPANARVNVEDDHYK